MKIWKLVSGILSIVMFIVIIIQSLATHVLNVMEENAKDTSAGGGILVAFALLVAGITSACVWKYKGRGADIALIILFGLAALFGFNNLGTFGDLVVWSSWAALCAGLALISLFIPRDDDDD